jgi:hypothetical protein
VDGASLLLMSLMLMKKSFFQQDAGPRLRQQRTPPRELLPGGSSLGAPAVAQRDLNVNGHAEQVNGSRSDLQRRRLAGDVSTVVMTANF